MANLYDYRPVYYMNGIDVSKIGYPICYISPVNRKGTGTRNDPLNVIQPGTGYTQCINILANGMYRNSTIKIVPGIQMTVRTYLVGQNMRSTVVSPYFDLDTLVGNGSGSIHIYVSDICFPDWSLMVKGQYQNTRFNFYSCWFKSAPTFAVGTNVGLGTSTFTKCIIQFPNNISWYSDIGQNSYLNTDIVNIINSLALYDNCKVTLDTQARLTTYLATYAAFDNCSFKIGNEANWTPLTGTTETEMRASFVARCQAQGWTVPTGSEFADTNMYMYRWVFSTASSKNGVPLKGSIIHNFEKRRFVTFGYETKREGFAISANAATKDSFNTGAPNSNLEFAANTLTFPSNADITNRIVATSQSNIKWLGGKYKLTALDIVHNMPVDFGVMIDNTPTIDFTPVNSGGIVADTLYIVRSTDKNYATITYNGVAYDTAVANNNYIFRGVAGVAAFTITSGNAVIYKVSDFVQHQTLELRVVNKIPSGNIAAGTALTSGYWYLVEHDTDQSNTTDYVTYSGVNYPVGGSFLASGTGTFTKSGSVHLRRCWKDAFDYETETLDKAFWQNEQKPKWCKIAIGDTPRCFMTANSASENEMQSDSNGEYLTTGNPDFYKKEGGVGGVIIPSYPIQGTYVQLRLTLTTTNPM